MTEASIRDRRQQKRRVTVTEPGNTEGQEDEETKRQRSFCVHEDEDDGIRESTCGHSEAPNTVIDIPM